MSTSDELEIPTAPAPPYSVLSSPAPSYTSEIHPTTVDEEGNPPPNPEAENLESQLDGLWAVAELMEERVQIAIARSSSTHALYDQLESVVIDIARFTMSVVRLGDAVEPLEGVLALLEDERTIANHRKMQARKDFAVALRNVRRVEKVLVQMAG